MTITKTNITRDSNPESTRSTQITILKNPGKTRAQCRTNFSKLFTNIFLYGSIGAVLLSACAKSDEFMPPAATPVNANSAQTPAVTPPAPAPIATATYYIAPTGNDASGNGSSASPWKSLNKACSAVTTLGAVIHVNAGTYIESSQCVLANGVSLDGEGVSTSIIKSHLQGGIDDRGAGILRLNSGSEISRISNITFDGDNLTGYVAISVIGRSNVEIHHCNVTNFYRQGILFDGGAQTGNKVHDNVITNSGGNPAGMDARGANLGVWNNTGMQIYNNTVNQKTRTGSLNGTGISIGIGVYGLQIFNNTILAFAHSTPTHPNFCFAVECWSSNKSGGPNSAAIGGWGTHIYKNTFEGELDIAFGGDKAGYDYSYYVHDNIFGDGIADANPQVFKTALQFEGEHRYVIVSNNTFRKGLTLPLYFCDTEGTQNCQDIQIFNNTFEDVTFGYMGHNGMFAPAIDFGSHGRYGIVKNISILNNTFTANRELGGSNVSSCAIFLPTGNDCDNVYIKNNIFTGFLEAAIIAKSQTSGGTLNNLVLAKNIYYNNGNNNDLKTISFTPTNVTDDHGTIANPLFISTTDFHLQASSPAKGSGVSVSIASDKDGSANPNPPSIGAYK